MGLVSISRPFGGGYESEKRNPPNPPELTALAVTPAADAPVVLGGGRGSS